MIAMRARAAALALAGALTLAGCTSGDGGAAGVRVSDGVEPSGGAATPPAGETAAEGVDGLAPYRLAVELLPCPESDPAVAPLEPVGALGGGLPALTLECLDDGPEVTLSGLRGRPMIVNVWASWCPPCIAEMPLLQEASVDLAGEVLVLGIDMTDRSSSALELLGTLGVTFASVVDERGQIRGPLTIPGPPVTFFVDADGRITGRHDGSIPDAASLDRLIETYLGIPAP